MVWKIFWISLYVYTTSISDRLSDVFKNSKFFSQFSLSMRPTILGCIYLIVFQFVTQFQRSVERMHSTKPFRKMSWIYRSFLIQETTDSIEKSKKSPSLRPLYEKRSRSMHLRVRVRIRNWQDCRDARRNDRNKTNINSIRAASSGRFSCANE